MTNKDKALVVFQGKKIRRTWFNDEWWFVGALTGSKDPSGYLKDMRRRMKDSKRVGANCHPLEIATSGGKQRKN